MKEMLEFMKPRLDTADSSPVFLTGDFNAPSHQDWTTATAHLHGAAGPIRWPASTQVVAAGMIDSFRAFHPDPLNEPGFTWSPVHQEGEPQDRIDSIYHKGYGVVVKSSRVFNTGVPATVGPWSAHGDLSAVRKNPWPSDH